MTITEAELATLTAEERAEVEALLKADLAKHATGELYDHRQDGALQDPRDLGPVGG